MTDKELLGLLLKYVHPRKNAKIRKNCRLTCDEMDVEDYEKVCEHFGVKLKPRTRTAFALKEKASDLFVLKLVKINNRTLYQLSKDYKLLFTTADISNIKNISDFEVVEVQTKSTRSIKRKLGYTPKKLEKWNYGWEK